jgi:serine/threonine protein kinase
VSTNTRVRTDSPELRSRHDGVTEDLSGLRVGAAYRLTEPIGTGATGAVWRAVDVERGVEVAVKLLHEELMRQPKAVTRFLQERSILQMLQHPNIVRVHDLLTVGNSLGLVMELVEGGSLRDFLRRERTLPPAEAATLLSEVAGALAEAHRNGVVHRDLKPDNILLDQGSTRLTDFGIARLLGTSGVTTSGAMVGTANYLAPEVIYGGNATTAVDVYALGVTLYELLTGRPPYAGGPAWAVLRRHVERTPDPVAGMPPAAWRVITACMDRRPGRRPKAEELVTTLRTLAKATAGLPALDPDQHAPETEIVYETPVQAAPVPRPRRRNLRSNMLIILVLAVAATVLGVPALKLLDRTAPEPVGEPSAARSQPAVNGSPPVPGAPHASAGALPPPSAGASMSDQPAIGVTVGVGSAHPVEIVAYGPWQCAQDYTWDLGHPVLAKPCHSTGTGIKLVGKMTGLPGIQTDVTVSLLDAQTGDVVSGPFECDGLVFSDFAPEHDCGPFEVKLPHGRRLVVSEAWQYTGRSVFPSGNVKGPEFSW